MLHVTSRSIRKTDQRIHAYSYSSLNEAWSTFPLWEMMPNQKEHTHTHTHKLSFPLSTICCCSSSAKPISLLISLPSRWSALSSRPRLGALCPGFSAPPLLLLHVRRVRERILSAPVQVAVRDVVLLLGTRDGRRA